MDIVGYILEGQNLVIESTPKDTTSVFKQSVDTSNTQFTFDSDKHKCVNEFISSAFEVAKNALFSIEPPTVMRGCMEYE